MASRTRGKVADKPLYSTHELELRHQAIAHQAQIILKDEGSRRIRVRRHIEGTEMEELRSQLTFKDQKIQEFQSQLQQAESANKLDKEALASIQTLFTAQSRDLQCLKAELGASSAAAEDSAQVLSEKLRLARELNILKPEVEHLRSQVAYHSNVIAEKLSLERQLNAAEVELEAERKARREAARRDDQGRQVEEDLRRMLKDAEKKIKAERKERERQESIAEKHLRHKADLDELNGKLRVLEQQVLSERRDKDHVAREAEVAKSELQAKIEMLEQRLETLKAKLRASQADSRANEAGPALAGRVQNVPLRKVVTKQRTTKKRVALDMSDVESAASSPEKAAMNSRKAAKKRAAEHSIAGEKSLFSVTPFLSRNKTLSLDALAEDDEEEGNTSHVPAHGHSSGQTSRPPGELPSLPGLEEPASSDDSRPRRASQQAGEHTQKAAKPRGRPRKALVEASPNITVSASLQGGKATSAIARSQQKLVTAPWAPNPTAMSEHAVPPPETTSNSSSLDAGNLAPKDQLGISGYDVESKKKRRRLATDVSRTIFDEPEPEPEGPVSKARGTGKMQLGTGVIQRPLKAKKIGLSRNAFGGSSFSPLKKDRRGVGASFLV